MPDPPESPVGGRFSCTIQGQTTLDLSLSLDRPLLLMSPVLFMPCA